MTTRAEGGLLQVWFGLWTALAVVGIITTLFDHPNGLKMSILAFGMLAVVPVTAAVWDWAKSDRSSDDETPRGVG